jgi:hypothetical protein
LRQHQQGIPENAGLFRDRRDDFTSAMTARHECGSVAEPARRSEV